MFKWNSLFKGIRLQLLVDNTNKIYIMKLLASNTGTHYYFIDSIYWLAQSFKVLNTNNVNMLNTKTT